MLKKGTVSILLILIFLTYSLNNFCEQSQVRFGITFCTKCQTGFKSSSFSSCVPCEKQDFSFQCFSKPPQTQLQLQSGTSMPHNSYTQANFIYPFNSLAGYGSSTSIPTLQYPNKLSDSKEPLSQFKPTLWSLPQYHKDQNCLSRDFFRKCTECKSNYELNKQNGLCQSRQINAFDSKLRNLKCLIYSDITKKCVKCYQKFGLKDDGTCVFGLAGKQSQDQDIYGISGQSKNSAKKTTNKFSQDIELPLKNNMHSSFSIQEEIESKYFLIGEKYLNSDILDRIGKYSNKKNQCKKKVEKKCIQCDEGYLLNSLFKDSEEDACEKVNQPVIKFIQISKNVKQERKSIQQLIIQHLTKYVDPYSDQNCLLYSKQGPNLCKECRERYFYSGQAKKCLKVDEKCSRYQKNTGKCYFCKFGYITVKGQCTLLNQNNFESGYKAYMNSPTFYFKDPFR